MDDVTSRRLESANKSLRLENKELSSRNCGLRRADAERSDQLKTLVRELASARRKNRRQTIFSAIMTVAWIGLVTYQILRSLGVV